MDVATEELENMYYQLAPNLFPEVSINTLACPTGPVDLFVDIEVVYFHQIIQSEVGNLKMLCFQFTTSYLLNSLHPSIRICGGCLCHHPQAYSRSGPLDDIGLQNFNAAASASISKACFLEGQKQNAKDLDATSPIETCVCYM